MATSKCYCVLFLYVRTHCVLLEEINDRNLIFRIIKRGATWESWKRKLATVTSLTKATTRVGWHTAIRKRDRIVRLFSTSKHYQLRCRYIKGGLDALGLLCGDLFVPEDYKSTWKQQFNIALWQYLLRDFRIYWLC